MKKFFVAALALVLIAFAGAALADVTITITQPVIISGTTYTTGDVSVDDATARQIVNSGRATYATTPAASNVPDMGAVKFGGLVTLKGGISYNGSKTITVPNATGTMALTSGVGSYAVVTAATTSQTLTTASCGKIFSATTGTLTLTLPATVAGCKFGFINNAMSQSQVIAPNASDKIWGIVNSSASIYSHSTITGIDAHSITMSAVSGEKGAILELVGDGSDGWIITRATSSVTL